MRHSGKASVRSEVLQTSTQRQVDVAVTSRDPVSVSTAFGVRCQKWMDEVDGASAPARFPISLLIFLGAGIGGGRVCLIGGGRVCPPAPLSDTAFM